MSANENIQLGFVIEGDRLVAQVPAYRVKVGCKEGGSDVWNVEKGSLNNFIESFENEQIQNTTACIVLENQLDWTR